MKTQSKFSKPAHSAKSVTRREQEALEEIEKVLTELIGTDENGSDSFLIIVEGKKDALSLRNLGVAAEIYPCANQPAAAFCEQIAETKKKVIILTDWDRKGRILASRFIRHFQNLGASYDETYRERLLMYTKKEIKDVESLYSHVTKLRQKCRHMSNEDDFIDVEGF
ncbi:MAG: toprim domain-containing protein [Methanimicrococcus sp.]|nr:toprim domain-containing protein [Methanimicrococcus sp.]